MKKKTVLCLLLCACLFMATGCSANQKYTNRFFGTFDTMIILMGYTENEETFNLIAEEVVDQFTHYHRIYDAYNAYEGVQNLYVLNRDAKDGPVKVEPELMDLLVYCRDNQPLTNGKVNIALGSVLNLWHIYRDMGEGNPNAELPPMEKLESAAQHVNFDDVIIDEEAGTVAFADPQLRLDIGAVAKGYATEQVSQWLLQSEMPSFLISAGGNVRAGQSPLDGRVNWGISIQDPDGSVLTGAEDDSIDVVFTKNASVVTSGDYQRFFVVDGVAYHHLIDPDTLMPAQYHRSVTVVTEDSAWADLLSTALFLTPYEEGRAFADSLEGVEVLWMLNDGNRTLEMTDGMSAMLRSHGATSK